MVYEDAGIVDEDVDPAHFCGCFPPQCCSGTRVGEVRGNCDVA